MALLIKNFFSPSKHNRTVLGYLVRPSWLSGFVAAVVGLAVVVLVIISGHYSGSTLQQLFVNVRGANTNASVASTSATVSTHFSTNVIVSDIPLFIFWAGVGLVIYSLASNIFGALRSVVDLEEEMHYVNLNRRELLQQAVERLVIRVVILLLWLAFVNYSTHTILPYAISLARVSTGNHGFLVSASYPLGAVCLLAACLHLHTIFLRMLLLKPRVFWQSAYD